MHITRLLIDRRIDNEHPDGHACHTLLPVKLKYGVRIEVTQCSYLNNGAGCSLMKITDRGSGYSDEDYLKPVSHIMGECNIIKMKKDQYLATVLNNNCKLATMLSESGCFLMSAIPRNEYEIEWILFAANSTYLSNFITRLQTEGYPVKRLSSESMEAESILTSRQEEIIDYAYRNGYYESPKNIGIDDLAKKFNCSKSTMSVILKGAEKKLIGAYFNLNNKKIQI